MQIAHRQAMASVLSVAVCGVVIAVAVLTPRAQEGGNAAPRSTFDGSWPKLPLPNKWTFGGVTGLTTDSTDLIWVLHRPADLDETENFATLNPPTAECCTRAPAVANRIQVFTKQGKFIREFHVARQTRGRGSAGGIAFSRDPQQRYVYVSDIMNNVVWIINRADGKDLSRIGFQGHSGGGFHWLHMVATDSRGNVYTGEVDSGKRVQKFVLNR